MNSEAIPMKENQINSRAAILTVGVHILLLLLCLFIGYTLPASPAITDEMGMEVNLGNSDDGSGDNQAFSTEHPAYQPEESSKSKPQDASESTPDLTTDENDADAPSLKAKPVKAKVQAAKPDNQHKTTVQQKPKILFPAQNGNGGNGAQINQAGGSEGNGTGNGDKGVAGGTPGAANYAGIPGTGTGGIAHSFNDRSMIAKPKPDAEFREGGKVVVRVTVNRDGQVINKSIKSAATPELGKIALKKIEEVRFSKSEQAPPEQFGDITFVFKTRAHK